MVRKSGEDISPCLLTIFIFTERMKRYGEKVTGVCVLNICRFD